MSVSLTAISPNALKQLMKRDTIQVLYKAEDDTPADEMEMLCENLPKSVATTFSTTWSARFPPINQVATSDLLAVRGRKMVMVVGGNPETWKELIDWMVACCKGNGLAKIPTHDTLTYSRLYELHRCANQIGCTYLSRELTSKMDIIEADQIHPDDIRYLWGTRSVFLADHCATRFWNKSFKGADPYWELREELPALDQAVNAYCAPKQAARDAAKQAAYDEREARRQEDHAAYLARETRRQEDHAAYLARETRRQEDHAAYLARETRRQEKAAYEERKARRQEEKAAYEKREARRQREHAAWEQREARRQQNHSA